MRTSPLLIGIGLALLSTACGDNAGDDSTPAHMSSIGGAAGSGTAGAGGTAGTTTGSGGSTGGSAGTPGAAGAAGSPGPTEIGIPFGPYGLWSSYSEIEPVGTDAFDMSMGSVSPGSLIDQLDAARSKKLKMLLAMTGGAHENYMTNGVFDLAKWTAKMDTYDTPEMHDAIAKGVADGTIVGNSVMDEPHVYGLGDGNTWGPKGTMTKAKVDVLCAYVKKMFPELPVGVAHQHDIFEPENSYKACEFLIDQYSNRWGDVDAFRDGGLALGKRDDMAILFSINILNGGIQAVKDGTWNCPLTTTGGRGTYNPNCRMTPDQVRSYATTLGVAGCAMTLWRYDLDFMSKPENQKAFADVSAKLAVAPRTSCARP